MPSEAGPLREAMTSTLPDRSAESILDAQIWRARREFFRPCASCICNFF